MAKANLVLPDGTTVNIEGSANEVAGVLAKFSTPVADNAQPPKGKGKKKRVRGAGGKAAGKKLDGPTSLVTELAEEGYFKTKRTLRDIQKKLEELGHIYAMTSISPALTRLTRKRSLRRIKEKKGWVYVK